jgi:hypothetical protein
VNPRVEKIFDAARRLTPETRDAFLEKSCGEDTALRQEVEELLESATDAAQFLETPAARIEGPEPEVGREIGPFTVREVLGEGAFGVVYLAEQTTPVRRRVALKVLKPGMDSKEVLARFEAERQALALMDHPGIARIHEVGETPRGRSIATRSGSTPRSASSSSSRSATRSSTRTKRASCTAISSRRTSWWNSSTPSRRSR